MCWKLVHVHGTCSPYLKANLFVSLPSLHRSLLSHRAHMVLAEFIWGCHLMARNPKVTTKVATHAPQSARAASLYLSESQLRACLGSLSAVLLQDTGEAHAVPVEEVMTWVASIAAPPIAPLPVKRSPTTPLPSTISDRLPTVVPTATTSVPTVVSPGTPHPGADLPPGALPPPRSDWRDLLFLIGILGDIRPLNVNVLHIDRRTILRVAISNGFVLNDVLLDQNWALVKVDAEKAGHTPCTRCELTPIVYL